MASENLGCNSQVYKNIVRDEKSGLIREIGGNAVWSLSSCKPGFGIDQLRDNNLEVYWQSDGTNPHLVNIFFNRKTTIKLVLLYMDFTSDESYTPSKISIRAGNHYQDLQEIELLELDRPSGWLPVYLRDNAAPVRAFHLQIAIILNHQNGRDSHLRQCKIYCPVNNYNVSAITDLSNFCR